MMDSVRFSAISKAQAVRLASQVKLEAKSPLTIAMADALLTQLAKLPDTVNHIHVTLMGVLEYSTSIPVSGAAAPLNSEPVGAPVGEPELAEGPSTGTDANGSEVADAPEEAKGVAEDRLSDLT